MPYDTLTGSATINDGEWHSVGIVYDISDTPNLKLYVDGNKENETAAYFRNFGKGELSIGQFSKNDHRYWFSGYMDDIILTTMHLTEEQVMQYHQDKHKTITLSGQVYALVDVDGEIRTASSCNENGVCEPVLGENMQSCYNDCGAGCNNGICPTAAPGFEPTILVLLLSTLTIFLMQQTERGTVKISVERV